MQSRFSLNIVNNLEQQLTVEILGKLESLLNVSFNILPFSTAFTNQSECRIESFSKFIQINSTKQKQTISRDRHSKTNTF